MLSVWWTTARRICERIEPTDVGADMIVGSLIKNPGGGLAPIGGYIVGRKDCIDRASYRLSAPGLGKEVGASLGLNQSFYQGLFLSPTVVAGALKGAIFAANIYEKLGFAVVRTEVNPAMILSGCYFWNSGGSDCFLSGNSGSSTSRQLCNARAVGYTGIRCSGYYGSSAFCGLFY